MTFPNVDEWERTNDEAYVYPDGPNVRMNLMRFIPSSKRFRKEDDEAATALETFIVERGLFLKKIDVICKYMDYFVEYFDDDKELPIIMIHMKSKLDSGRESITMEEFVKLIQMKFFHDTNIKKNIYRMVEANYHIDVTVDQKTGRVFNGPNDFTNDEIKRLLAISIFMRMVIPITSQYISTNTLYTKQQLSGLITTVFVECFYMMGDVSSMPEYGGPYDEDDESAPDGVDLMRKLYIFTTDKIIKHHGTNPVLWNQQTALRGLTESKHTDVILTKHLLGNNMFKFQFDNNIMSFLKSIVETQLLCTINRVKYKLNPIRVDSTPDYNGISGVDKLEQSMAKLDEGEVIRCRKSLEDVVRRLKNDFDIHPTDEETTYYAENFLLDSGFHVMLMEYFYAKIFDGYMELKTMDLTTRLDLLVICKHRLEMEGYDQLPWLITSISKGKTTNRLLQNAKFTNELTTAADYINLTDRKYKYLKNYRDDEILSIISRVLNNSFTYVEYDHQDLTGTEIEFDQSIIGQELLRFIDNI